MFEEQMPICNKHLVDTAGIKTHLSGSTAIMALLHSSGLLTIANVGDSRCLIGRLKGEKIQAEALNTDHTPLVPEEAARITACKVCCHLCAKDIWPLMDFLFRILTARPVFRLAKHMHLHHCREGQKHILCSRPIPCPSFCPLSCRAGFSRTSLKASLWAQNEFG